MNKVLFIHRSVGENLVHDGCIYNLFSERNAISFSDFNQNTGILRDAHGSKKTDFVFPGNDTKPENFSELFSENTTSNTKEFAMSFDLVVIKSCYPNSNITSHEQLEAIKEYYTNITQYFTNQRKHLLILTSPPLVPLKTTRANALRAAELSTWLSTQKFGEFVSVFDFFSMLAEKNGSQQHMLAKQYRRLIPIDSHPNKRASREIAQMFVQNIVSAVTD